MKESRGRPALELIAVLGVLIAIAAIAGELAERYATDPLDDPAARWFEDRRGAGITDFMKVVTVPGSSTFLVPAVAVAGLLARLRNRGWRPLVMLASAYAGSLTLTHAVKALVDRPRPMIPAPLDAFTGSAFPSGHAAKATAVFLVLGALLSVGRMPAVGMIVIWSMAILISLLVGISRLYLGAHWLSDVLAGLVFGGLWAWAVVRFGRSGFGVQARS